MHHHRICKEVSLEAASSFENLMVNCATEKSDYCLWIILGIALIWPELILDPPDA